MNTMYTVLLLSFTKRRVRNNEVAMSDNIKYPCLLQGIQSGTIVLFTSPREGTVKGVGNKHQPYNIGDHSTMWVTECFEPFIGVCYG